MNYKLKAGAFAPIRAHKQDAGVDLLSPRHGHDLPWRQRNDRYRSVCGDTRGVLRSDLVEEWAER